MVNLGHFKIYSQFQYKKNTEANAARQSSSANMHMTLSEIL